MTENFYRRARKLELPALGALALCFALASASGQDSTTQAATEAPKRDALRAEESYLAGARWIDRRDPARAATEFEHAVALNPAKPEYAEALAQTRNGLVADLVSQAGKAQLLQQPEQALALLAKARRVDPQNPLLAERIAPPETIRIEPQETGDALEFAGPLELTPAAGSHTFHLHGDMQQVVRDVADAYGVKATFDDSVVHSDIRFALEEAPYGQSMPILLHMTHLFAVPLTARSILVVKDTQDNRQKYERQVEETVYVPGSTNEQMSELVNIVKNVFDVKQISVLNDTGTLLIRAPEETLKVVNYTLADLIDGGAEVSMRLQLFETDKSWTRNTGATVPNQFGAFSFAAEAQSIVAANQSIVNQAIASGAITLTTNAATNLLIEALFLVKAGLATSPQFSGLLRVVGGGLTTLGVYEIGGATFNLSLNSSDIRTVDDVQVRVANGQTNTLKIGSRYPITTSRYSTGAGSSAASSALAGVTINGVSAATLLAQYTGASGTGTTATTPQIQYEDLGLTLKTTPIVEKSGLVAMHVDLKIQALTGASIDSNPILSSRALVSDVTVADGASAVIVSEMSRSEMGSLNGLPGLSELPGFQDATENTTEKDSTELVMILTPHVIRRRRDELTSPRIAFHTSTPQDY